MTITTPVVDMRVWDKPVTGLQRAMVRPRGHGLLCARHRVRPAPCSWRSSWPDPATRAVCGGATRTTAP